jgi:hypothetical protein
MTLGASWQAARWNVSAFAGWHRGWPRTPLTLSPLSLGRRNSDRWGTYYSLDMRGSYIWPLAYGDFSLVLEVTNATNRDNECCAVLETDANGNFTADVDHWLPTIVNLGFSYRWRSRH